MTDDAYSASETIRRREATIKKMLATPPAPRTAKAKKKKAKKRG